MTSPNHLQKYPASRDGINVLLIGDADHIAETSRLLWDTLPKFGAVGIIKGVSLHDGPSVDLETFQLFFFHLPSFNGLAELGVLLSIREKNRMDKTVCVLIIPELGSDISVSAADFVLTQPVTVQKMEKVLKGCRLVTERGQGDCMFLAQSAIESSRLDFTGQRQEDGVSEQESMEFDDGGGLLEASWRLGSPSLTDGSVPALLHSRKEQKRRLQIKKCCNRLRELLPFVNGHLNAASTLELTVAYVSYIQQRLSAELLQKVMQALQDTRSSTWYKSSKASKNRKQVVKENSAVKLAPTDEDFADDFIAAHVLGRHIQARTPTTLPQNVPAHVMVSQAFVPLMDFSGSSAPMVIMQRASPSFVNPMVINQMSGPQPFVVMQNYVLPEFFQHPPLLPRGVMDYTFSPRLNLNTTFSPSSLADQYESMPVMVDHNFPLAPLDPVCPQAGPLYMTNQSYAPTVVLNQTQTELHVPITIQPSAPLPTPEDMSNSSSFGTASTWLDLPAPDMPFESSGSPLPSFSTFLRESNSDPLPQSPGLELLSPTLPVSSQAQGPSNENPCCPSADHTTQDFLQDLLDLPCALQDDCVASSEQTSLEVPVLELCEQYCSLSQVSMLHDLQSTDGITQHQS